MKWGFELMSFNSIFRFYYRCTYKNDMKCPATKQVTPAILHCFPSLTSTITPAATAQIPWEAREILLRNRRRGRRYQSASARTQPVSSLHSWHPRQRHSPQTYILSESINNQRGAPMQASFSGQPHRHLQVTVCLRWRLTVFQEQAFHPAAGVLCLGHCCRLVSPDASSTSISCDAVHGRRRLCMLGGRLVPVWSVKCWEATLLSRAWTTGTQPTDRSPYRYYNPAAYFFTFILKPRFCAWMMWRMVLEFLLFDSTWYRKRVVEEALFVCLEIRLVCMSRIAESWQQGRLVILLLLKHWILHILYSNNFIKMSPV